jgi:hypothetical protein
VPGTFSWLQCVVARDKREAVSGYTEQPPGGSAGGGERRGRMRHLVISSLGFVVLATHLMGVVACDDDNSSIDADAVCQNMCDCLGNNEGCTEECLERHSEEGQSCEDALLTLDDCIALNDVCDNCHESSCGDCTEEMIAAIEDCNF